MQGKNIRDINILAYMVLSSAVMGFSLPSNLAFGVEYAPKSIETRTKPFRMKLTKSNGKIMDMKMSS